MGGLSAPREETDFRQLQCQLQLLPNQPSLVLQLQPLSLGVWLPSMELMSNCGVKALQGRWTQLLYVVPWTFQSE